MTKLEETTYYVVNTADDVVSPEELAIYDIQ